MEENDPASTGEVPEGDDQEEQDRYNQRLAHAIGMLLDDDEMTRIRAAEVLGRLEDPAAVEALIDNLWDDDARVRLKTAWALGRIGDMRAYAPLQRLYRMENEGTREIIAEALDAIRLRARS
jgi:HEAT repeat protein